MAAAAAAAASAPTAATLVVSNPLAELLEGGRNVKHVRGMHLTLHASHPEDPLGRHLPQNDMACNMAHGRACCSKAHGHPAHIHRCLQAPSA